MRKFSLKNEFNQKSTIIFLLLFFCSQLKKVSSDFAFDAEKFETDDFKSLRLNDLLIDKSNMILRILDLSLIEESYYWVSTSTTTARPSNESFYGKSIIIHRPEGWGKTVNMNMLETFFEIEVDEDGEPLPKNQTTNDKFFIGGELRIGQNETKKLEKLSHLDDDPIAINNHLGKHPVIFLRLKNVTGGSYKKMKKSIKSRITDTFEKHSYLMKSPKITDSDKKKFLYYWKSENTKYLKSSLHFLSEKLHQHFHRDVIVLIDDYDIPVVNSFLEFGENREEFEKVRKLLVNLYTKTVSKEIEYRKTTIFTGVLDVVLSNTDIFVKEFGNPFSSKYTWPGGPHSFTRFSFQRCFGFDYEEIRELLDKLLPNVHGAWYTHGPSDGNKELFYMSENFFNPRLTMRYLSHNFTSDYYKSETAMSRLIDKIILSDEYQEKIQILTRENNWRDMVFHQVFSEDDPDQGLIRLYPLDGIAILYYNGYVGTKITYRFDYRLRNFLQPVSKQAIHFFRTKVTEWLVKKFGTDVDEFRSFVGLLLARKMSEFKSTLQKYLFRVVNYMQGNEKETRLIFNGLRLAFYQVLSATHEVRNYDHWNFRTGISKRVLAFCKEGLSNTSVIIKQKWESVKSKTMDGSFLVNIDYSDDEVNVTFPLQRFGNSYYDSKSKPLDEIKFYTRIKLTNIIHKGIYRDLEDNSYY